MKRYYLVNTHGYNQFIADVDCREVCCDVTVRKITAWDKTKAPYERTDETDFYLSGTIKWDGCSHIYFNGMDYDKSNEVDGYYHICGRDSFESHMRLMQELYNLCMKLMAEDVAYIEPGEEKIELIK